MLHGEPADSVPNDDFDDAEVKLTPLKRQALALTSPLRKQRRIVDDEDEFMYGEEPVDGDLDDEDDGALEEEEDEESFALPSVCGSRRKAKEDRK